MERSNQPPKTEGCSAEGKIPVDLHYYRVKRPGRSVPREKGEPQAGPASGLSNSASIIRNAGGDVVWYTEPKMSVAATGEAASSLTGSESVARTEGDTRNWGGPEGPCRTNCEGQAGKEPQRKEAVPQDPPGVRSVHSTSRQGASPDAAEGSDTLTQPAQATGPVRMTESDWQTFLRAIAEKAQREPRHRFGDLYRKLNQDVLRECFFRLRKDAASGVDGVSFQAYEQNLEANLTDLVGRLKRKTYRARLVRRKYIPKGNGKLRPLGIPTLEEKLLQMAVTQILLAIFEVDFLPCSYGYRPGLGPHDAIKALTVSLQWGKHQFVTEADIQGFFDHLQHDWLLRMLGQRIQDGALLGLISKWLRAGILETDGQVIHPLTGTPQGGVVSPVLANIYLHYALDLWFTKVIQPKLRGRSQMIRYADDFVVCFAYRWEAQAFEKALNERLAKFGLQVAPDKTRTLRFGSNGGQYNGRFDFLGFEFYWEADRKGLPRVKRRTATKKWRASVQRMKEWIIEHRHQPLKWLMRILGAKLRGSWNYYGLVGNSLRMNQFYYVTRCTVFKWLNRRSQRRSLTWPEFNRVWERFQVPGPRIVESKERRPCQMELSFCQRIGEFLRTLRRPAAYASAS
jgi:RNA-directed DNA polymerase